MRVESVRESSPLFRQVIALGRRHKATLGVLPDAAFKDRARRGTLFGAVDEDENLIGYALFDLPGQHVHIRQLCVEPESRRSGVAEALVDEIEQRFSSRQGIRAHCRRDYGIDDFWAALEFVPRGERPGRGALQKPLVLWWRDLSQPTLFDTPVADEPRIVAAIDHNIFIDLTTDRREGANTREVLGSDWVIEAIELVITDEVHHEIERNDDDDERKRQRRATEQFRRLRVAPKERDEVIGALTLDRSPRTTDDVSDVRHLAMAIAGGADLFITRDRPLRQHLQGRARQLGIRMISPTEIVTAIDEVEFEQWYRPGRLAETELEVVVLPAGLDAELSERFTNRAAGERRAEFVRLFDRTRSAPNADVVVVRDRAGVLSAVIGTFPRARGTEISLFRVIGPDATTIARQLLGTTRDQVASAGGGTVLLTDPWIPAPAARALAEEGFLTEGHNRQVVVAPVVGSRLDVAGAVSTLAPHAKALVKRLRSGQLSAYEAAELEHELWPLKLLDVPTPNLMLRINPPYAEALFDIGLSEQTLLHRPTALGLSREHVYYRAPTQTRLMQAPARILWYVTGERGRSGTMAIRAASSLREVVVGEADDVHARFAHLGTYSINDVRAAGEKHGGRVMAMRFSDTELFETPVERAELERLAKKHQVGLPMQGPAALSTALFADLYRLGRPGVTSAAKRSGRLKMVR